MNRRNRPRADSVTAAIASAAHAGHNITPPPHVPIADGDIPFFRSVCAEFARSEWTDHALELAAMLARAMADLEREQAQLRTEGFIATRENGTRVENPRSRVVRGLTGDILSLRRSLSLHARAKLGEPRDQAKRRANAKAAEGGPDDDLLASPV